MLREFGARVFRVSGLSLFALGLLGIGGLSTVEVPYLEINAGLVVAGLLLYTLAAFYILTATPGNAMIFVACLSVTGIVAFPNFGAPLSVKLLWPVMCIPLACVAYLRENTARRPWGTPMQLLLILLAYGFASAFFFDSTRATQALGLQIVTLVPLVLLLPRFDPKQLQSFILFVVALASVEAVLAILEVLSVSSPLWGLLGEPLPPWAEKNNILHGELVRGMGTMAHPIPLGMLCAFSAFFLLVSRRLKLWLFMPVIGILLSGIIASGTRSAVIVFIVAVIGVFVTRHGQWDWAKAAFVSLVVCTLALGTDLAALLGASGYSDSVEFLHRADALAVPSVVWSGSLARLILGTNPDIVGDINSLDYLKSSSVPAIDNQWVALLVNYGLIGVFLLICILGFLAFARSWPIRIAAVAFTISTWTFDVLSWNIGFVLLLVISQPSFGKMEHRELDIATFALPPQRRLALLPQKKRE